MTKPELSKLDLREASHRRLNPLTGEWTLVSPHRMQRPWHGKREAVAAPAGLAYDPACYLCAGNARANGARRKNGNGSRTSSVKRTSPRRSKTESSERT